MATAKPLRGRAAAEAAAAAKACGLWRANRMRYKCASLADLGAARGFCVQAREIAEAALAQRDARQGAQQGAAAGAAAHSGEA